jgi:hypothetical protein
MKASLRDGLGMAAARDAGRANRGRESSAESAVTESQSMAGLGQLILKLTGQPL